MLTPQLTLSQAKWLDMPTPVNRGKPLASGVEKQWGLGGMIMPQGLRTGRGKGCFTWSGESRTSGCGWFCRGLGGLIEVCGRRCEYALDSGSGEGCRGAFFFTLSYISTPTLFGLCVSDSTAPFVLYRWSSLLKCTTPIQLDIAPSVSNLIPLIRLATRSIPQEDARIISVRSKWEAVVYEGLQHLRTSESVPALGMTVDEDEKQKVLKSRL